MPEYKYIPQFIKAIEDRTVIGLFAIHGAVDDGLDRSHPGSLADYKIDGRTRVRFLWQHDMTAPPIASINYIREISRADLPEKVLAFAPDATGAAEVSRTYLDTPRGNEVLNGIRAGAIEEMSYAYDVQAYSFTEDGDRTIRELQKMRLWDISDVNHGMNPATVAAKRLPLAEHSDTVLAAVKEYTSRLQDLHELRAKEGRVLSGDNRKRIENAVEALAGASSALKELLVATEPKTTNDHADTRKLYREWQELRQRTAILGVFNQ